MHIGKRANIQANPGLHLDTQKIMKSIEQNRNIDIDLDMGLSMRRYTYKGVKFSFKDRQSYKHEVQFEKATNITANRVHI